MEVKGGTEVYPPHIMLHCCLYTLAVGVPHICRLRHLPDLGSDVLLCGLRLVGVLENVHHRRHQAFPRRRQVNRLSHMLLR